MGVVRGRRAGRILVFGVVGGVAIQRRRCPDATVASSLTVLHEAPGTANWSVLNCLVTDERNAG